MGEVGGTLDFPAARTGHKRVIASWPAEGGTETRQVGRVVRNASSDIWTAILDCRCGTPIKMSAVGSVRACAAVEHHFRMCGRWWE